MNWQPTATVETLQARAKCLSQIRQFFETADVMEVDVPVLATTGVTDLHIDCISVQVQGKRREKTQYLQSSPEYYMKRLLAAGHSAIYYLGKAFRQGESGPKHQPEFTMLEWYRPGWNEYQLMDEVSQLMQHLGLKTESSQTLCYSELFEQITGLNPHQIPLLDIQALASSLAGSDFSGEGRSTCLDLIFSLAIEPKLPSGLVFIHDYPSCQSALALLGQDSGGNTIAHRFEAYFNGMELANGYYELTDPVEMKSRFDADIAFRHALGKPPMAIDSDLLAAMESGLPVCAGVALGVDRLLMQLLDVDDITRVTSFGSTDSGMVG